MDPAVSGAVDEDQTGDPLASPPSLTHDGGSEESSLEATPSNGEGTLLSASPDAVVPFPGSDPSVPLDWGYGEPWDLALVEQLGHDAWELTEDFCNYAVELLGQVPQVRAVAAWACTSMPGQMRRNCQAWHQRLVNITSPGTLVVESSEALEAIVPDPGERAGVAKECTWKIWIYAQDSFQRLRLGTVPPPHTIKNPRGFDLVIPHEWVRARSWAVELRDFAVYFTSGFSLAKYVLRHSLTALLGRVTTRPLSLSALIFAVVAMLAARCYRHSFPFRLRFLYDDTVRAEAETFVGMAETERSTEARANCPVLKRLEDFVKDRYPAKEGYLVEWQTYMVRMSKLVAYGIAVPGALAPVRTYEWLGSYAMRHLEAEMLRRELPQIENGVGECGSESDSASESHEEKEEADQVGKKKLTRTDTAFENGFGKQNDQPHYPEPHDDLTVRPRDFKIDQGKLKPLRLGVTIYEGGLYDDDKQQDPSVDVAGGIRMPQLCNTAGPMAQNRWNELCGVTRHLQAVPEWDEMKPEYMGYLDLAGDMIFDHLMKELDGRVHEIGDRTRTPITWGAEFRERMENEATAEPRPFLGGHNKPLEPALIDLAAGDQDKLPRLIGDVKPQNASKAAEYVQPLEEAVKLVLDDFTFKGLTLEEVDTQVETMLRECEEGMLMASIDFGAFDSTKSPNDMRWERKCMLGVVARLSDSWHKLVDPKILEAFCEEKKLAWRLRFITILMEYCDYILFSGLRGTSVGNILTVLRHFVAEIIRVHGATTARHFLRSKSRMRSRGDGDDQLAVIFASMYRYKDGASLAEMSTEMAAHYARYGKRLEVTITRPEHGCEVLSRFHLVNKDCALHFPKPKRLFQRLEYYCASDLNVALMTDGKKHVIRDKLFHERCATSLLSGLRNCVELTPVAYYMLAGARYHLRKLPADATVSIDNRLRLRAEAGLVDLGFGADRSLREIYDELSGRVHSVTYGKWHWSALVKLVNFGKQLDAKSFQQQLKDWQGFTDRMREFELNDEDFQYPELVVNRIDFPKSIRTTLGLAAKIGSVGLASDVRPIPAPADVTAAFRAAASVGTSGGPGSSLAKEGGGRAKATGAESAARDGAPAKPPAGQAGKKGKNQKKNGHKEVFSSRVRGQRPGGGSPGKTTTHGCRRS